ncbi:MAG: NADH-quinone oxidoreductase subunit NuoG [Alphaproteobacteria bacterium]
MPKLTIDGIAIEVEPGTTLLQACEMLGIEIPRFCYHERLAIAGNCRMCLVEMERSPKPIASCAMPAMDNMVIKTNSPMVEKARRGVMEFLLINHPLDCPICDQGGECDLQDMAVAYGGDSSRYREAKRAVKEKNFGPLIKTAMTRCIHCTRCIRFATDVAGVEELGATGRGETMEVGTYVERTLGSELSGNIIDLCPVGALTSKPYAFAARSWELTKTESIDTLDAVGSNIRVDSRGPEVMRVLPRLNDDVNEEWISDKTRFAYDGLKRQRLDRPYVREGGKLRPASWQEAFQAVAARLKGMTGERIAAIAGDQADCESMLALKDLMRALLSPHLDCRQDGARLGGDVRAGYVFNTTIAGIENADLCLLVGTNPRAEAAIVNARLRKRYRMGGFQVAAVGPALDLTYPVEQLGAAPTVLDAIAADTHAFARRLRAAKNPMIVVGQGALARPDGAAILFSAGRIADTFGMVREGWNGFNVLHTAAARVGGLDLGFVPGKGGRDVARILEGAEQGAIEAVYLLGADEIDLARLKKAFVIYQGHHGDRGAEAADVILPGAAYTEKSATFVNTEGRVQATKLAVFPPGDAREDWKILRALGAALGLERGAMPYDGIADLRRRMAGVNPVFGQAGAAPPNPWGEFGAKGPIRAEPLDYPIKNFYMTDPITRASATMAMCVEAFILPRARTGTDG